MEKVLNKNIESVRQYAKEKPTHYRFLMLALITIILVLSTADRATLSIAGPAMEKDLNFGAVQLGYLFSAFSWAYVLSQTPAGWVGDIIGTKKVMVIGVTGWSIITALMGIVYPPSIAYMVLLGLRFLMGVFEAPVGASGGKIIAAWFPSQERGIAGSIYNCAQYISLAVFTPLMGYIVHLLGWHYVYFIMGAIGIVFALGWQALFHMPRFHKGVNKAELNYIESNGGLIDTDITVGKKVTEESVSKPKVSLKDCLQLFKYRIWVGIFIAQYCVTSITWFYLSWFPIYLMKERGLSVLHAGMMASVPAIAGCIGGICGGLFTDWLFKKTGSLTIARKVPITIGFCLSTGIIACNYVDSITFVMFFMSAAFFGKGLGSIIWTIVADAAPKEIVGMTGGLLNSIGQAAGIITPIAIGYIIAVTGSFEWALVYVGIHGFIILFSYWVIVGPIKRVKIKLGK